MATELTQGSDSVTNYIDRFRRRFSRSGLDEDLLCLQFIRGLQPSLRSQFEKIKSTVPKTLKAYMAAAVLQDERWNNRRPLFATDQATFDSSLYGPRQRWNSGGANRSSQQMTGLSTSTYPSNTALVTTHSNKYETVLNKPPGFVNRESRYRGYNGETHWTWKNSVQTRNGIAEVGFHVSEDRNGTLRSETFNRAVNNNRAAEAVSRTVVRGGTYDGNPMGQSFASANVSSPGSNTHSRWSVSAEGVVGRREYGNNELFRRVESLHI